MDITALVITLVITGIFGGILAGFLGLGGGLVYVPVLVTVFEISGPKLTSDMHTAVGSSLALLIPSAITAVHKHIKEGNVVFAEVWRWCIFVFIGAIIGSIIVHYMPELMMKIIFNVFVYCCIAALFPQKETESGAIRQVKTWIKSCVATVVGLICVMLGIGGGTLTVPFYKYLRHPYKHAVAVSSCGAIVIGLAGGILMIISGIQAHTGLPRFSFGYVNWLSFVCIAPLSMVFAHLGAKWVTNCPEKITKTCYLLVLLISALYMTYNIIMHH